MSRHYRREVLTAIGGLVIGGSIVQMGTDTADATSVSVDSLSIQDTNKDVSAPVNGLTANVDGSFTIDGEAIPDKIVIRFEAKRTTASEYTQIAATDWRSDLSKQFTKSFNLSGNVLDLPNVTAPELSPTSVGNSKSISVDFRVKVEVTKDSRTLESHTVVDTVSITVTRTLAGATIDVEATGNITIST